MKLLSGENKRKTAWSYSSKGASTHSAEKYTTSLRYMTKCSNSASQIWNAREIPYNFIFIESAN